MRIKEYRLKSDKIRKIPDSRVTAPDIFIIAALIAAAVIYPVSQLIFQDNGGSLIVSVRNAGTGDSAEYPLDIDRDIDFMCGGYSFKIRIKDKKVSVYESDCPNQICVNTPPVSKPGSSIICVPAELVVEIKSAFGKEAENADFIIG